MSHLSVAPPRALNKTRVFSAMWRAGAGAYSDTDTHEGAQVKRRPTAMATARSRVSFRVISPAGLGPMAEAARPAAAPNFGSRARPIAAPRRPDTRPNARRHAGQLVQLLGCASRAFRPRPACLCCSCVCRPANPPRPPAPRWERDRPRVPGRDSNAPGGTRRESSTSKARGAPKFAGKGAVAVAFSRRIE